MKFNAVLSIVSSSLFSLRIVSITIVTSSSFLILFFFSLFVVSIVMHVIIISCHGLTFKTYGLPSYQPAGGGSCLLASAYSCTNNYSLPCTRVTQVACSVGLLFELDHVLQGHAVC